METCDVSLRGVRLRARAKYDRYFRRLFGVSVV